MSNLFAVPEFVTAAANDLAGIGSTISSANAAASSATTGVLPAAADEVSAAVAALFGAHGEEFQTLSAKVSAFHNQFVQNLNSGAASYAESELANLTSLRAAAPSSPLGNLIANELAFNSRVVNNELNFENTFLGGPNAINGAAERFFNTGNAFINGGEQALDSVVGATGWTPTALTLSLQTGSPALVFNGGAIGGGVESILDQFVAGNADLLQIVTDLTPFGQYLSPAGVFNQMLTGQLTINTNVVNGELNFNTGLVTNESAFVNSFFIPDALRGPLYSVFNILNSPVGPAEQLFNSLLGATNWTPEQLTIPILATPLAQLSAASVPLLVTAPPTALGELFSNLSSGQLTHDGNLVSNEYALNSFVLNHELGFEDKFLSYDAFNGGENRLFNAENTLIASGEGAVNTLVGATGWSPQALTASLLTGSSAQVFNGGSIGGIEGFIDQSLATDADIAGLLTAGGGGGGGVMPLTSLLGTPDLSSQYIIVNPTAAFFDNLQAGQLHFNTNLVNGELGFNTSLLNHELGFENTLFGPDAFNGALNRGFNVANLPEGIGEEVLNSVVGATGWSPQSLTASLLTGSSAQVFNGGAIGGAEGIFDQSLAGGADLLGLLEGSS